MEKQPAKDKHKTSIKLEKRHFFRHYFDHPILHCKNGTSQYVSSFCKNISEGGLKFQSPVTYEVGDLLSIKITLLVDLSPTLIPVKAYVAWVSQNSPDPLGKIFYSIGVTFQELPPDVRIQIKEIISTLRIEEQT